MKLTAIALVGAITFSVMSLPAAADSIPYNITSDYQSLDDTSYGYGMGRDTDSAGRPYGADSFNADYGSLGAYAIFEPGSGVVLTFDEGYENGYTSIILDTLRGKNVKAIFFVTGDYVKDNKALVKRMIDEGHIIGNHGMKHKSIPGLSLESLTEDIMSLHELVKAEFDYDMMYFRPPCGEFSERSLAAVKDLGYTTLMWSFAYVDWEENNQPNADTAFERITSASHEGEIMLLHAVSSVNADLMPEIIDTFREKGLEFVLPVVKYVG
ncbi:MAG: polysaccharide deacetylase family protein [Ruminococcus sp.]|jgi:peptidoglycan-N-acetylmuramic acid deacetylase|nr:polysaccharide deacetylase family protein [Ruminococcus sp.]